jgi:hypothetical protein
MATRPKLSPGQRRLLLQMAAEKYVILIQRYPDRAKLRYTVNSFPMRQLSAVMVAKLARRGLLQLSRRGYYELTTRGMLVATLCVRRKRWQQPK